MNADELKEILDQHKLWLNDSTKGKRANLRGANLSRADLSDVSLIGANLSFANLSGANLRGANLPTVTPCPNLVAKIAEQIDAHGGSLDMRKWHTCDTTHCLAGWAVTLHPEGKKLESEIGTSAAAALIFNAACGEVPDFHSSDSDAMEWLKSKAKKGAQL